MTTQLPALNAVLNTIATILLVMGLVRIKQKNVEAHKRIMVAALFTSAAFLSSYLVYHALHGSKTFEGPPLVRTIYLTILLPHTLLAAVNLPFIIVTVWRAYKEDFQKHKKVAKFTWWVWMFVSVTGVVIYLMNYQLWPGRSLAQRAFDAAQVEHRKQKDETALPLYEKAAGLGHVGARCFAATLRDRVEETDTASVTISRALARFPDEPSCLTLKARSLVVRNKVDPAMPMLTKAAAAAPNDPFVHATLGMAHFRKYRYKKAAAAFERTVQLDESMTANIFNAGYAHYLYGNYPAAKKWLERALAAGVDEELAERAKTNLDVIKGALWVCPMHSHITGKEGDTCSECKMALEPLSRGVDGAVWEDED